MKLILEIDADGKVTGTAEVPSTHHIPPSTGHGVDQETVYHGRSGLRAANLSPADLVYLRHVQAHAYHVLGRAIPDIYKTLLVGTAEDMRNARNAGEYDLAVQQERSRFNADPAGWVAAYGNETLKRAYHEWLAEQ